MCLINVEIASSYQNWSNFVESLRSSSGNKILERAALSLYIMLFVQGHAWVVVYIYDGWHGVGSVDCERENQELKIPHR